MARTPTPRKESATFRLEPQLKYMAEVASRVQKRNLTNYIEWAIEHSLEAITMNNGEKLIDLYSELWDVNEVDRFLRLSFNYPELMTYEEQEIFKVIIDNFNYLKKDSSELSDKHIIHHLSYTKSYDDLWELAREYNRPEIYFFSAKTIKKHWEDIKALKPFNEWENKEVRNGFGTISMQEEIDDIPF